jgi:hypothetical protein
MLNENFLYLSGLTAGNFHKIKKEESNKQIQRFTTVVSRRQPGKLLINKGVMVKNKVFWF